MSRKACRCFLVRLLQMREERAVKGKEQRSSQTVIAAVSSYVTAAKRNGFCKCGQRKPVESYSSLQGSLFPALGDVLCQHLLCAGSPLRHFKLSVATFGFAHLVSVSDLLSQLDPLCHLNSYDK